MNYYNEMDEEQQRIFDVVAVARTKEEAARTLGISRATLYRRLNEAEIQEAISHSRTVALSETTHSLSKLANDAAHTLDLISKSKDAPYSARVAAASKILDLSYRSYELDEVAGQIDELERELSR